MKKSIICFLLTFAITNVFANNNLSSPRNTFKTFLQAMKSYKQGDKSKLPNALQTIDLSQFDTQTRQAQGEIIAQKLISTLDKLEYIKYENIPESTKSNYWVYKKQNIKLAGKDIPVEISLELQQKNWLFSKATVNSISDFERSVRKKMVVQGAIELKTWKQKLKSQMPEWTAKKSIYLMNGQWIALLVLILTGVIIERLAQLLLTTVILKQFQRIGFNFSNDISLLRFRKAIGMGIFTLCWIIFLPILELQDAALSVLLRASKIICTIALVWSSNHLVHIISEYFNKVALSTENKFDDILIPLLRKTAKVFIFSLGIVFIANSFTLDITNLLAGLGIGGLAFALAAKDTLSNLFGSLTVILDRPFEIGDAVIINGSIEGAVESVGFRSTKIRTWYDSVISVPNNQLTNVHIDNWGKRKWRRLNTTLGLQYDTPPEKVETFCEGVRQIIINHPDTRKDSFHVYFYNYGPSSLDIMVYCFFKDEGRAQELQSRHKLLMDIFRFAADIGIDFAFPTQTVHMIESQNRQHETIPSDIFKYSNEQAQLITKSPLVPDKDDRSSIDKLV